MRTFLVVAAALCVTACGVTGSDIADDGRAAAGADQPLAPPTESGPSVDDLDWTRCELGSAGVTVLYPDGWQRSAPPFRPCITFAPAGSDAQPELVRIETLGRDVRSATRELLDRGWRLLPGPGLPPGITLAGSDGRTARLVPLEDGSVLRFTARSGSSLDDAGISAITVRMATSVRPVRVAGTPSAGAGPGATSPDDAGPSPNSRVRPQPGYVALTFDDGPHPTWTPLILDLLDDYDAVATFFVIGSSAERYPELVREIADRGHSVQNHTQDHDRLTEIDDRSVRDQLRLADAAITATGAPSPRCVRPPYGSVDDRVRELAAERDLDVVLWNVDTLDWKNPGVDTIVTTAVQAEDRDIVLFHDGPGDRSQTVEALPWILRFLSNSGFGFQRLCADPPPS